MKTKLEELKELRDQLNISINGLNNYQVGEPNLIICNHNCLMDIFYLPSVLPEETVSLVSARLMYKKDPERKKMVNRYLNAMPIEAHGGRLYSSLCLKYATELLCNNISLNIFPEGAYVPENIIYRGRTGASRILFYARKNGIKPNLIPVSINIKNEIKDLDNFYPNDDEVEINILEPINYDEAYFMFMDTNNPEYKNTALHMPIDEGMRLIADSIDRKYVNEYIKLRPKNNVIFDDGSTLDTSIAQSLFYIQQYNHRLDKEKEKILKALK